MKIKSMLALFTALNILVTANASPTDKISQVYFFGDSLTDSGFNDLWSLPMPLPSGKAPTFTTFGGYTWSQYLARDIKGYELPKYASSKDTITNNAISITPNFVSGTLNGINYAAAGSTTNSKGVHETWAPSLNQQVEYYLTTHQQQADPNAVYFIWSGANDILAVLLDKSKLPTQAEMLVALNSAVGNIVHTAGLLSAKGAKKIVVMNLPDFGNSPLVGKLVKKYNNPHLAAEMTQVSFIFNSRLERQLKTIPAPQTKILYFDTFGLVDNIIATAQANKAYTINGQSFEFNNSKDPACDVITAVYCSDQAPKHYIFADLVHPTDDVHRIISLKVEEEMVLNFNFE